VASKRIDPDELKRRGIRLKRWRDLRGLKQEDVALAAGVNQSNWSTYENGHKWMHGDTLGGVLRALRITDEQLMGHGPIDETADHAPESSEFDGLDPKEQVRRESVYQSAPPTVRYWFDHDDSFTAGKDISKLTVRAYQRRLEAIWADFDAGALSEPGTQLEGSTMQPDEPDPDAPARKR
jgi:transcriptional regulator with XRE-family HTH domain